MKKVGAFACGLLIVVCGANTALAQQLGAIVVPQEVPAQLQVVADGEARVAVQITNIQTREQGECTTPCRFRPRPGAYQFDVPAPFQLQRTITVTEGTQRYLLASHDRAGLPLAISLVSFGGLTTAAGTAATVIGFGAGAWGTLGAVVLGMPLMVIGLAVTIPAIVLLPSAVRPRLEPVRLLPRPQRTARLLPNISVFRDEQNLVTWTAGFAFHSGFGNP